MKNHHVKGHDRNVCQQSTIYSPEISVKSLKKHRSSEENCAQHAHLIPPPLTTKAEYSSAVKAQNP